MKRATFILSKESLFIQVMQTKVITIHLFKIEKVRMNSGLSLMILLCNLLISKIFKVEHLEGFKKFIFSLKLEKKRQF
jgi:hypothetical protein